MVSMGPSITVSVAGGVSVESFSLHIQSIVGKKPIQDCSLKRTKGGRVNGQVHLKALPKYTAEVVKEYAACLRKSTLNDFNVHASVDKKIMSSASFSKAGTNAPSQSESKSPETSGKLFGRKKVLDTSISFLEWLRNAKSAGIAHDLDLANVDRASLSRLFGSFTKTSAVVPTMNRRQTRSLEFLVVLCLRERKRCQQRKVKGKVFYSFVQNMNTGFSSKRSAQAAAEKNVEWVDVSSDPQIIGGNEIVGIGKSIELWFWIIPNSKAELPVSLSGIRIGGRDQRFFKYLSSCPVQLDVKEAFKLRLSFTSKGFALRRGEIFLDFEDKNHEKITISRKMVLRTGDSGLYDILKPKTEFQKKRPTKEKQVKNTLNPPSPKKKGQNIFGELEFFNPPEQVKQQLKNGLLEDSLLQPVYGMKEDQFRNTFIEFWHNMIWANELQALEDVKTFDMQQVKLKTKNGRLFSLNVPGLAEGRPSVLKGDTVICFWKGINYKGRVEAVTLLDVEMEFHQSFHKAFDTRIDRIEQVRFTFSRLPFRTSHDGVRKAPQALGQRMLYPTKEDLKAVLACGRSRTSSRDRFVWKINRDPNVEQRDAISRILKGETRPMPYIIFGPPGTGKTTTVTEAIYQLAMYGGPGTGHDKLRILVVAPSNDVTDVLAERLCEYFDPTEMTRVLAFSRSLDQVPSKVRRYIPISNVPDTIVKKVETSRVVVTTVSMAARLSLMGVKRGFFDVLIVDEAGHATEPEIMAVASTMVDFHNKENPGQLVLAGDPMQLGPVVTSKLCKRKGLAMSWMERMIKTSPAYEVDNETGKYPPELVTFLVQNYRSHPSILKLPNGKFYRNELQCKGDVFSTHSFVKWEHLPQRNNFPVLFHAVQGENTREGNSPSWFNPEEAVEVTNYVQLLVKHTRPPVKPEEIGIISPYVKQVHKIDKLLKARKLDGVRLGSVERFQGQEFRCIIISTVRSETKYLEHDRKYQLGFVANEKRFNVAITRAKALLIVVGNPHVLATDTQTWLPFLRYCRDNQSWKGEEWNEEPDDVDFDDSASTSDIGSEEEDKQVTEIVEVEAVSYLNREE